jgi:hypothetical protein
MKRDLPPPAHAAGALEPCDPMQLLSRENETLRRRLTELEEQRDNARLALGRALLTLDDRDQELALRELRIATLVEERDRVAAHNLDLEQQNTNLVYLQVAAAQLHATYDRPTALAAIRDIVINLIGSEELAIWAVDERNGALPLLDSCGLDREAWGNVPLDAGQIGLAAVTGQRFVAGSSPATPIKARLQEANLTACIPLKLGSRVIAAIGIFSLLPQKGRLEPLDLELFELLASQGAEALDRDLGGPR